MGKRSNLIILLFSIFFTFYLTPLSVSANDTEDADVSDEVIELKENSEVHITEEQSVPVEGESSITEMEEEEQEATDKVKEDIVEEPEVKENLQQENTEVKLEEIQAEENETALEEPQKDGEAEPKVKVDEFGEELEESDEEHNVNEIKPATMSIQSSQNTFQLNDRDEAIKDIKRKLNAIGFDRISITANFGNWTETRVKQFQDNYGLRVTGVVDKQTLEKLEEVYHSPYQIDNRHEGIIDLKEKLNRMGFGNITVTNLYGSFTIKKVKEFQRFVGMKDNGIADDLTREKLDNLVANGYERMDRQRSIKSLKRKLNAIGFGGITVTDLYGSFTERRVKEFQEAYDLPITGRANKATLDKIDEVYSKVTASSHKEKTFKKGDKDEVLKELKKKLNAIGFDNISVTPNFGGWTETRVKQFQRNYELKVNGELNKATQEKLDEVYNSKFQTGERNADIIELKNKLNRMGFGYITVTELYGNFTVKKVQEFQRFVGMKDNGIADALTRKKLDSLLDNGFKQGDTHRSLNNIKRDLNQLDFGYITVTSNFGNFTEKKVREFQKYYGLKQTGRINAATLDKIESIMESPFQKGKRHNDTKQLKKDLNRLGFGNITISTLYGSFTDKQVRKFQDYYGLKEHGIADEKTIAKINELISHPLQKGKRHNDLISIKEKLNSIGYGNITVTNYFGSFTEKKLKEFQRDNGLPVSGIADSKTINKLNNSRIKIFLDPGHGGSDSGAVGYGLKEKDVVLDIAKETAKVLTDRFAGVAVKLSRTTDKFIELEERADMANKWGADYFVSFHNNATRGSASGFETFIYNGSVSKETVEKQEVIHNYLIDKIGIRDRGLKTADFSVLRNSDMPAILIEYMFIDNFSENAKLKSNNYREFLGEITAEAIAKAYNLKKK